MGEGERKGGKGKERERDRGERGERGGREGGRRGRRKSLYGEVGEGMYMYIHYNMQWHTANLKHGKQVGSYSRELNVAKNDTHILARMSGHTLCTPGITSCG